MIRFELALAGVDRHRRRHARVRIDRALRGHHHRAAATGVRAGVVRLAGRSRDGGWGCVIGTGLFLGVAALFYSLLLGYAAFTLAIMGVAIAVARRSVEPLLRLLVIAGDLGSDVADQLGSVAAGHAQRLRQPTPALP